MSVGDAPFSFPLGRVQPPEEHWPGIVAQVGMAPRAEEGPLPESSIPLFRWRNPRSHAQLAGRGCCTGESIASMLETNCRIGVNPVNTPTPTIENPSAPKISPLWIYYIARAYSAKAGRQIWGDGAIVSDALLAVIQEGVIEWQYWPGTPENYANYSDTSIPSSARMAPRIKVKGEAVLITNTNDIFYWIGVRNRVVVVGTAWRGGMKTDRAGNFQWSQRSVGGHAYVLSSYSGMSSPSSRVSADNSWDNAGWGVQPEIGAKDANGNLLPRGFGFTSLNSLVSLDLSADALSSGRSEAIVIEGLDLARSVVDPKPPSPPDPTPEPQPVDPLDSMVITIATKGKTYVGKVTEVRP